MNALIALIVALLRALLPALIEGSKDSMQDGDASEDLRDKLRGQVRRSWGPYACLVLCLMSAGCFTRTIYVPDGTPVRLRETVEGAKVWVLDSEGKPVASKMDLPEGWYVLPMEDEDE